MFEHHPDNETSSAASAASPAQIAQLTALVEQALALADKIGLHGVGIALDGARVRLEPLQSLNETDKTAEHIC